MTFKLTWMPAGLAVGADVYHAHDLDTLAIAAACARLRRAKLVYDSHELWIDWVRDKRHLPDGFVRMWSRNESRLSPRADCVITVSDGIAGELQRLYGIERPLVVRNCAELQPAHRSDKLRRSIGGDSRRTVLLYQGGFMPGRGLAELVAAADAAPEADFVLLGPDSPYKAQIARGAAKARHANVHMLPYVPLEQLWDVTCSADAGFVLIQPVCRSYELGESNKVYEYMAAGIAIIASDVRGHRRLGDETGALDLVDPYDPADIARAVNALTAKPDRMRRMGRQGRLWAERRYNAPAEMGKLAEAYARLEDPPQPTPNARGCLALSGDYLIDASAVRPVRLGFAWLALPANPKGNWHEACAHGDLRVPPHRRIRGAAQSVFRQIPAGLWMDADHHPGGQVCLRPDRSGPAVRTPR